MTKSTNETASTAGPDSRRFVERLRDHRECGGGGCDECAWSGIEITEPFRPDCVMPADEVEFEIEREECPCYEGCSINEDANQCMHADADGEICEPSACPLVTPSSLIG